MAKRKKSNQQPKSKKDAHSGTWQPATASQAVADVAPAETEPVLAAEPASQTSEATGLPDAPADPANAESSIETQAAPSEADRALEVSSAEQELASPAEGPHAEATLSDVTATLAHAEASGTQEPTDAEVAPGAADDVQANSAAGATDGPAADAQSESTLDEAASATGGAEAETGESTESPQTVLPLGDATLAAATGGEASAETDAQAVFDSARLESIIESLLFASEKALGLSDLKRLLGERDGKKITAAVQTLMERRKDSGVQVVALSSGWHLRTNVDNAAWVSKLLVGRPIRLSRAMMETLAIVAYRQPVTRPEIDDIRGVDCGPVLKTLLERGLVRIIGKKEEVGRPMLYGTTPEFLRVFNLRDLAELPTLREFYDLSAEDQSKVEAEHGEQLATPSATTAKPDVALTNVMRGELAAEPEDTDPLLDELDEASKVAKKVLGDLEPNAEEEQTEEPQGAASAETETKNEPESAPAGE